MKYALIEESGVYGGVFPAVTLCSDSFYVVVLQTLIDLTIISSIVAIFRDQGYYIKHSQMVVEIQIHRSMNLANLCR